MEKTFFLFALLFFSASIASAQFDTSHGKLVRARNIHADSGKAPIADGLGGYSWQPTSGGGGVTVPDTTGVHRYSHLEYVGSGNVQWNSGAIQLFNSGNHWQSILAGDYVDFYNPNTGGELTIAPDLSMTVFYQLTFPPTAGSNGQVLTGNGSGTLSWTTPSGALESWIAADVGSPVLAPTVGVGTKSLAALDSSQAPGFESISIAINGHAGGYKSVVLGNGKTDVFVGGDFLWANGDYSVIIGSSGKIQGLGSIGVGNGITENCTYNNKTNFLGGGNNSLFGTSTFVDTGSYNLAAAWAASCYGRSSVALGDGAVTWRGCSNISLGGNAGSNSQTGVHSRQIFISGVDAVTDGNVSHFDSSTEISGLNLLAYARGAYYQGYNNLSTATAAGDSDLWVLGNGKVYGNVNARNNAFSITRKGVGTFGNVTGTLNGLLPSQTSNSGKFLTTDGTNTSWGTAGGVSDYLDSAKFNFFTPGAGVTSLTGQENTAVGIYALNQITTGTVNVAVGDFALTNNITGIQNTAIGSSALANDTSQGNTAVGANAGNMSGTPSGFKNCIFLGNTAGFNNALNDTSIRLHNTFIAGSYGKTITDVYFGGGYKMYSTSGQDYTIHGTGGAFTNSNNGGNLILSGGTSTGTGRGGNLVFKVAGSTGASTNINYPIEIARFDSLGLDMAISTGGTVTPNSGGYYQDNAIIAWGNIAANGTITSQFGNFGIAHTGASGVYTITLPTTPTAMSVTVSPQSLSLFNVTVSGAVITVNTDLGTIAIPIATDVAFFITVTGRP